MSDLTNAGRTVSVWRDNRTDQEESYRLEELANMFDESKFAGDKYRDAWPLVRCVGTWLSSWAVMEPVDQEALTDFIASGATS